ncbi:RraA family protein [Nitratidesulfovibrio sp. D1]|uniref:RraA family protein n=1 Tax=Nitratidesulfovibrio sp. D1 TaxID=3440151 RepID=UPI003EBEB8AB
MSNPGYRVKNTIVRPDATLVEAFRSIPVSNIGDAMNRMACMHARIRPMNRAPLLGTALTVRVRVGDNLLFNKAMDMARPGDVLVVNAHDEPFYSIVGGQMTTWMKRRGLAGLVVDGCIRDAEEIEAMDFPVYATGISPNGPVKEGGGEVNFPVACGGLVVNPGDIVAGDRDGVVVVSPADAPAVLEKAHALMKKEARVMAAIADGTWDRTWVDEMLRAKGCEFID